MSIVFRNTILVSVLFWALCGCTDEVSAKKPDETIIGPVIPMNPSPISQPKDFSPQGKQDPPEEKQDSENQDPKGENEDAQEKNAPSEDPLVHRSQYMQFEPYNTFPREIDLGGLEVSRLIRSIPVLTPKKDYYAYSEVMFVPNIRQTISKMYLVKVATTSSDDLAHLPGEKSAPSNPASQTQEVQDRYDPAKSAKNRHGLAEAGYNAVKPFDFKTLSIVDWSASGQKLLFKERSGVLHVGLRVTDILIYDETKGTVTIYPEIQRIINYYWANHGNLPNLATLSWEVQPLGWEPGSDKLVLMKAWAFDQKEKKFLGLWRYDVDAERTMLVKLNDEPEPVATNGWMATPVAAPSTSTASKKRPFWRIRPRYPFQPDPDRTQQDPARSQTGL